MTSCVRWFHLRIAARITRIWAALFGSPKKSTEVRRLQLQTPAELLVRTLFYLARWIYALAQGSDSFIVEYRRYRHERIPTPACEGYRPWEVQ